MTVDFFARHKNCHAKVCEPVFFEDVSVGNNPIYVKCQFALNHLSHFANFEIAVIDHATSAPLPWPNGALTWIGSGRKIIVKTCWDIRPEPKQVSQRSSWGMVAVMVLILSGPGIGPAASDQMLKN
jgi:hypothetical protein